MNTTYKTIGIIAVVLAIVAAASLGVAALLAYSTGIFSAAASPGGGLRVEERKSFPAAGIKRISVKTTSYDVRVTESADSAVNIRLFGEFRGASEEAAPHLQADLTAGTLAIGIERTMRFILGFSWSSIVLEVAVPAGFKDLLDIEVSSGDIAVGDHRFSEVILRASSGDIGIGKLKTDRLRAETSSGGIKAAAIESAGSRVTSTSGDIEILSMAGNLEARASSGDISVAFARGPGASSLTASSGEVEAVLPADADFSLDARSSSGDIACDFPITMDRPGGRGKYLQGVVGSAGPQTLSIVTGSGDVRIRKAG